MFKVIPEIEPHRRSAPKQDLVGGYGSRPIRVAYIGGTSFSGSTLLSFLLNAQPKVASVGEVMWTIPEVDPGGYICSCGATLDACGFWLEVSREMGQRGHRFGANNWNTSFCFTPNRLIRRIAYRSLGNNSADQVRDSIICKVPGWGRRLAEIGQRNTALVESIAAVTGASTFVDASKDHTRVRFLRRYSAIEPYIIHLVRDAPAFVNSCLKNNLSLRKAIQWWNRTAWNMERLRRTTPPERWLLVRYEDLCTNPGAEVARVLQFLGVSAGSPVLEFRSTSHHIIGNRWRLGSAAEVRLDNSWREALSKPQIDLILKNTTKYRKLLGYTAR